jgi:YVTN family beta-propeller protein
VGNDVQIYGSKMYAVINCSHKVEVLDAHSCQRLGQVDIPNCRYIAFDKGYAYVSAYVGPVGIDPNAQLGAVFQVDTATLEITAEVTVGYQPDELVIQDGLIYVANSGGYRKPNYDNTVSVIDIETMTQIRKIPVGINLHRIRADKYGKLWVSSRGDYEKIPSRLFVLEKDKRTNRMEVRDTLNVSCSEMDICGDSLYLYSVEWSNISQENNVTYGIIDVRTGELISNSFIKDGTETDIEIPYGLKVNPETGDVYVTDAKNYVSSGNLHCYGRDGIRKWSVRTGDIPAHMAFLYKNK